MIYIAFYEIIENKYQNRNTYLAAKNKIDYITYVAVNFNNITILSRAITKNLNGYYKGKLYKINDKINFKNFSTFGTKYKILKLFRKIISNIKLLFYLLKNVKRNEKIIVYHSVESFFVIELAKKNKAF